MAEISVTREQWVAAKRLQESRGNKELIIFARKTREEEPILSDLLLKDLLALIFFPEMVRVEVDPVIRLQNEITALRESYYSEKNKLTKEFILGQIHALEEVIPRLNLAVVEKRT